MLISVTSPAAACTFCGGGLTTRQTPREHFKRANYVAHGKLANPRFDPSGGTGSTEFHVGKVLKPDPAIGVQDVQIEYASGHMKVTVHNVGTKAAENVVVRVTDPLSGAVVAEEKIAKIEAPLDLVPRTQVIEFHNLDCVTCGRATVELNPDGKPEDDLNPFNNRVEYRY